MHFEQRTVLISQTAICKLEQVFNIFGVNKRPNKALKLPAGMGKNMDALPVL
jgi:hypothetical protein